MARKRKGRSGWDQEATSQNISTVINANGTGLSSRFKALVVTLAVWGLIPISWANHDDRDEEQNVG